MFEVLGRVRRKPWDQGRFVLVPLQVCERSGGSMYGDRVKDRNRGL